MNDILFALWFFAPAAYANMAPILANNISAIKKYNQPIDFGKTFRGKRIFGSHKTFRGLLSGIIVATAVAGLQMLLFDSSTWVQDLSPNLDYSHPIVLLMGAAMGFGALFGDALKSFFKRQIDIKPGRGWFPFDQIDYIVGGIIFSLPFAWLSPPTYLIIFIVGALLHPVINLLGWLLHLKDKPF